MDFIIFVASENRMRPATNNVAAMLECPPVCKVEMSDGSLHGTSTSPDLTG
jgi:hypothetical protein